MEVRKSSTNGHSPREVAHALVDRLSPDATWDDLMEQIYVRQAIEAGIADADAGRGVDVADLRARFGLPA